MDEGRWKVEKVTRTQYVTSEWNEKEWYNWFWSTPRGSQLCKTAMSKTISRIYFAINFGKNPIKLDCLDNVTPHKGKCTAIKVETVSSLTEFRTLNCIKYWDTEDPRFPVQKVFQFVISIDAVNKIWHNTDVNYTQQWNSCPNRAFAMRKIVKRSVHRKHLKEKTFERTAWTLTEKDETYQDR